MEIKHEMTVFEFRRHLAELRLSIGNAADLLGKSRRAIEKWSETGFVKDPGTIILLRLLDKLRHPPYNLSIDDCVYLLKSSAGIELEAPSPDPENVIKKLETLAEQLKEVKNSTPPD